MGHHRVDHAHFIRFLCGVRSAEEEDLTCALLAHLAREVGRTKPTIEACNVRVGLLEDRMLFAGEGHVAHHVKAVPPSNRPSRDDGNDDLVHEPNLTLHVQDVEPVDAILPLVSGGGTYVLVPSAAKGPSAILGRGALAGEKHHADVLALVARDQGLPKLVDRFGGEGIAHFGTVEGNARHTFVHFEGDLVVVLDGFPGKGGHVCGFKKQHHVGCASSLLRM